MKLTSIQGRLTLLLLAFFSLVMVAVLATIASLETMRQDAVLINLAGRQRMLVQGMTRAALQLAAASDRAPYIQTLSEASQAFDQTLDALQTGGAAPYLGEQTVMLHTTTNPDLLDRLGQVETAWGRFRPELETLLASAPASPRFQSALTNIETSSSELVGLSDEVVRGFEAASQANITRLRWIQAIFLSAALVLLAAGTWFIRSAILVPLASMGKAAQRIGSGDLEVPVQVQGADEMRLVGENLDQMRSQLLASRNTNQAWTGQLEQRVAQRTQELDALYIVSGEIASRLAIQDVLRTITQKTRQLLDCDIVFLCIMNETEQMMILNAADGVGAAIARQASPIVTPTVSQVLAGERALRCDEGGCSGYCEILAARYRASHLAAPLKIERQILGALCVGDAQVDKFNDDSIDLLTKLANIAAIALQNARLYAQAERLAATEERQRIAAEMHDGLAQTLSYTRLIVSQAAEQVAAGQLEQAGDSFTRLNTGLDQAIEDTRRAIASLQETGPALESLQELLSRLAAETPPSGAQVEFSSRVTPPILLSRHDSHQVVRVTQEALANARRHSQATHIAIILEQDNSRYRVLVEDNGCGFSTANAPEDSRGAHFGLSIMRARAAQISGRLEIQSTPGSGSRILLEWPERSAT